MLRPQPGSTSSILRGSPWHRCSGRPRSWDTCNTPAGLIHAPSLVPRWSGWAALPAGWGAPGCEPHLIQPDRGRPRVELEEPNLLDGGEARSRHVGLQLEPGIMGQQHLPAVGGIAHLHRDLEARAAEDAVLGQQVQPALSTGSAACTSTIQVHSLAGLYGL